MAAVDEPKAVLKRYLQEAREALLWKLDGLDERAVRWPRTPTGTNLAGIVKHCANVEVGYFGATFGRPWPEPDDPCFVSEEAYAADLQSDWYLPADVPLGRLVDFCHRVWAFADTTIDELALDTVGSPPWWPGRTEVTLHHMLVRVTYDLARHAGHADILREQLDAAAGLTVDHSNLPELDWPAYVSKLTTIAERFPERRG
jgi:hypothetical protein